MDIVSRREQSTLFHAAWKLLEGFFKLVIFQLGHHKISSGASAERAPLAYLWFFKPDYGLVTMPNAYLLCTQPSDGFKLISRENNSHTLKDFPLQY